MFGERCTNFCSHGSGRRPVDYILDRLNITDAGNIWNDGPTTAGTVIYSVVIPIICLFAIFGNLISLMVLRTKELKGSIFVYLAVLAFSDLCSAILLVLSGLSSGVFFSDDWPVYDVLLGVPFTGFFNSLNVLITGMITVDRILVLHKPISSEKPKFCHSHIARRVVIICFIVATVVNLPSFFIFEYDKEGNLKTKPFYYSRPYEFYNWSKFIVMGILATILLAIGNGYLIYKLRMLKKLQKKFYCKCSKRKNFKGISLILIVIVLSFTITEIPFILTSRASAATYFFEPENETTPCNSKALEILREACALFYAISISSDLILYCLFCPSFCDAFSKMLNKKISNKAVQMNLFIVDKKNYMDKEIGALSVSKVFKIAEVEAKENVSFPSMSDDEGFYDRSEGENNRRTVITLYPNGSSN